jgi:hypothetical protein
VAGFDPKNAALPEKFRSGSSHAEEALRVARVDGREDVGEGVGLPHRRTLATRLAEDLR